MVASSPSSSSSSSSRLKPNASSDQQQQQQTGGEEELKLLKQQMSALKLDHLTPVPQTSQVVEGEEEDDQVKLLNQKIAQLKLLPGEEEEVVEETAASSSISVDDRERLLLSLKEVLGKRRVRKRLLLLLKKKLQCLRVNVRELKVVDKQQKSMHQCRLSKIRDIVAEAQAIKAEAQRIAVENRRRCHQILDSIERSWIITLLGTSWTAEEDVEKHMIAILSLYIAVFAVLFRFFCYYNRESGHNTFGCTMFSDEASCL